MDNVAGNSGSFLSCSKRAGRHGFDGAPDNLSDALSGVSYGGAGRQVRILDKIRILDSRQPAVTDAHFGVSGKNNDSDGWGKPTSACLEVVQEFLGTQIAPVEPLPTARILPSKAEQLLVKQMLGDALAYPNVGESSPASEKKSLSLPSSTAYLPRDVTCVDEDSPSEPVQSQGVAIIRNNTACPNATRTSRPAPVAVLATWLNGLSKARFAHSSRHKTQCKSKQRSVRSHPYVQTTIRNPSHTGASVIKSSSSAPVGPSQRPAFRQFLQQPTSFPKEPVSK